MQRLGFTTLCIIIIAVLFLSSQLAWAAPAATLLSTRPAWNVARIDDVPGISSKMGDHAAVYDAAGTLHIAYGGDHLYYARCVGSACTIQTVDPSDYVGPYASLALDSSGNPHIAYYDIGKSEFCNDEKVKYARWTGSGWQIQIVEEGCLGIYTSIALDADNIPHISYFNESSDELQLADWDGNTWNSYTPYWLPSFAYSGTPSSLQSDIHGHLHLAFIGGDAGYGTVWYTQKEGDTWSSLVEVDDRPSAMNLSMTLDAAGNPHLSYNRRYYDAGLSQFVNKLTYTRYNGTVWQAREDVADMEYQGWTAVTVGTNGYPRLAYRIYEGVASVAKSSGGWGTPALIPGTADSERMYLGWRSASRLGLVFYSGGSIQEVTTDNPYTVWTSPSSIVSYGWVGSHIAAVNDAAGNLHVAYTDHAERVLRYAYRPAGGSWQLQTILTTPQDYLYIRDVDIDLNGQGYAQIVYQLYDAHVQRSRLKYMAWSGSVWVQVPTGATEDLEGCDPSLELIGANAIYIAYNRCDYINDNLWLAIYNGSWSNHQVDADEATSNASLYVKENGHMYISYNRYEYPSGDLRYAYKEDSLNWNIQDVSDTTYTPTNTSLVFDGDGHPHIAFITRGGVYDDYSLKHAAWSGSQWQITPVTTLAEYTEPHLAIDIQGNLHLAYTSHYHPAYATRATSGWIFTDPVDAPPVDPDFSFGVTSNIAISFNAQGLPVLFYDGEMDQRLPR